MALKEELKALRARLESGRPPEVVATMHTRQWKSSEQRERQVKAPEFVLPNAEERPVDSRALLAKGPLIVTFYRGRW
jgi:hypothetical protein